MAITRLDIRGYRSLRKVVVRPTSPVIVTGPNGVGKTNLYRAVKLVHDAAAGRFATSLADEGGMPSALWAGERRRQEPKRIQIDVALDDFRYTLEAGLPIPDGSRFQLDPEFKLERIEMDGGVVLAERRGDHLWIRDDEGRRVEYGEHAEPLIPNESMLSQVRDPLRFPILASLRERFLDWRFYHGFRTDPDAPLRRSRTGTRTPVLSHDGHDVGAALETIRDIGDGQALDAAIEDAFPGQRLVISVADGRFEPGLKNPVFKRVMQARELSDGTLRYLCLLAALLSPRPPALLALNEPETSLHPDLIAPLAALIAGVSRDTQVWVTTHSRSLVDEVQRRTQVAPIELALVDGETRVVGASLLD